MSEKSPNLDLNLYSEKDALKLFADWLKEVSGLDDDSNMMIIDKIIGEILAELPFKADLEDGVVPASQLPSFVDDVLEFETKEDFPDIGESGKIYVETSTNLTYRWSGSDYVEISASLALGETSSSAYRGDRGKYAYEHASSAGNPHGTTAEQVGARPASWLPTPEEIGADKEGDAAGVQKNLNTHVNNATIHVTSTERNNWNSKLDASKIGASNGVAPLDSSGKVPNAYINAQGGLVAQSSAPTNTSLGWIDTTNGNILKFYNGSSWQPVASVWG